MTRQSDNQRLEDAITLVAKQMTSRSLELTVTKLVKLLYFVDLAGWRELGRPVTGVTWVWHHYGPYSRAIVNRYESMAKEGELDVEHTNNQFGAPMKIIKTREPAYWSAPSKDLERLIRATVEEFGHLQSARIGDLSYETEPMRALVASGGQRGDTIEFVSEVESIDPHAMDRVRQKYRTIAKKHRGVTRGDIAEDLREIAADLDEGRRSAGSKVL